jgi:hypothetical protein
MNQKRKEEPQMKLTRHNGRSGKNGAYNPKHNDRRFDINNSDHIDKDRANQNVYWDCYQGYHFPKDREQEDKIVYSFEQIVKAYYSERYADFCEGQHERNRKTGHSDRDRTTEDLRLDKKTCPEESLIQIGTMEQSVPPDVLAQIAAEFFEEFQRRFGEYIHILDWSLHLDESTPHIHERHVFDCENRYGEIAPQQGKALEALGFDLPHPDQKQGKLNNRKMTFDAACRAMLFDICEKHGLHLDQEPEYGGRAYLEKQDYILMKQKEKMAEQELMIDEKESKLGSLTIRIEDTEKFIDEVSEVAYETAVEVVTDKVIEETHNADFDEIEKLKKSMTSEKSKNTPQQKSVISQTLDILMKKFQGMTGHISERLAVMFGDPVQKKELQKPIRKSIRERLALNQKKADEFNRQRKGEQDRHTKKRQQNMDR